MSAIKHNTADLIWKSPGSDIELVSINARLAISELYVVYAEIRSPNPNLAFGDMLNAEAKLVLKCGEKLESDRFFSGVITRLTQGRTRHGNLPNASKKSYLYEVEIRPRMWLLTKQIRSKVHQQKSAKDIIAEIMGEHGVAVEWKLKGSPPTREYCIQYEETDWAFVSRLAEDEGICYFFDQESQKAVFADHAGGHPDCKPKADAKYVEEISPRFKFGKQEFIQDFAYEEMVATGAHALNHYNYETSQTNIKAEKEKGQVPLFTNLERYEHTLNYQDKGMGEQYAQLRLEESEAHAKLGRGTASCRGFDAGFTMNLSDHFRGELNGKWLLTACEITAEQGRYACSFTALKSDTPFRPARTTPKPKVYGLQTATVTGPAGSKVYLDEMGRCKLQFHWDREGQKNDRASMWVRVSNGYAGKDYGIQWIPRVGHEALVTFVNGDPDLPLVTGRVYNDFNTAPLGPANKWQNIIKSIKDNHLIFDDEDGKERVDIRAEKDMETLVVNNDAQNIGADRTITVGHNHTESIGENMSVTVGSSLSESVGVNYSETVGSAMSLTIGASRTESVRQNDAKTVGGSESNSVGKNQSVSVGTDRSVNAGRDITETSRRHRSVDVGQNLVMDVGANASIVVGRNATIQSGQDLHVICGKKGVIEVSDQLTIKCGQSSFTLKKSGDIQIKGKKINIKASGDIKLKGSKISEN